MKRLLFVLLSVCLLAISALPAEAETMTRQDAVWYRVHLGTGTGQPVTPEEVAEFIDTVITERFPDGMSITEGRGQWTSKEYGLIKERTTIIDIQCEDSEDNFAKIREIADTYIKRFSRAKASCFIKRIPGVNTILYYQ